MKQIFISTVLASLILASNAGTADAKNWSGRWDGQSYSTLEFLDGKRVKYCFKKDCVIKSYSGNASETIRFKWGNSRFSFEWNGQGYNGLYRAGNIRSSILMD